MISAIAYNQSLMLPNSGQSGEQRPRMTEMELVARGDVVSIHRPEQMTDEDISQAMQSIEESVSQSSAEAMSVHGSLDLSRVMALLNDPV